MVVYGIVWIDRGKEKTEMIKAIGRLRSKYGATLEDIELPDDVTGNNGYLGHWYFISQCKNVPENIIKRYSMLYLNTK